MPKVEIDQNEIKRRWPGAIEAFEADEDWSENLKDPDLMRFFFGFGELFVRVDEITSYVWNRWNPVTKAWEDCDDI